MYMLWWSKIYDHVVLQIWSDTTSDKFPEWNPNIFYFIVKITQCWLPPVKFKTAGNYY